MKELDPHKTCGRVSTTSLDTRLAAFDSSFQEGLPVPVDWKRRKVVPTVSTRKVVGRLH